MKHQYFCPECKYQREGLLDSPAIGIGSYSTLCPECGSHYHSFPVEYSEQYDSYYNPEANEWLEVRCSDPTCEYCNHRPERPLNV